MGAGEIEWWWSCLMDLVEKALRLASVTASGRHCRPLSDFLPCSENEG
jgi:hypothetical protein